MSRCVQKGRRDMVGVECQAKNTGEKTAKKESNCVSMDFISFIRMHMYEMAPFIFSRSDATVSTNVDTERNQVRKLCIAYLDVSFAHRVLMSV